MEKNIYSRHQCVECGETNWTYEGHTIEDVDAFDKPDACVCWNCKYIYLIVDFVDDDKEIVFQAGRERL